ncbi:hypothetical protein SASPL_135857 [Salvia splendens]|uniref:Uncharacterized protein n=1 Tax=Salvia splendens TaxID=180675 RepID=A0A8X8X0B2_SALSN|nr:hypothetical protein SASPL_135857 [Salvia splendens]
MMSYRRFQPVRASAPPRSSTGISSAAAAGMSSRAVRGASIGNLVVNKKPSANTGSERREREGLFGDSQSRADEVDNWATNKNSEARGYEKRGGFGMESGDGGSDSSNWGKRREEEGRWSLRDKRGGMEAKREESTRPRLNLQPRTLPVNEEGSNSAVQSKGSSNPFGEARPSEEVLKDKAQDIKKIEEKLEGISVDPAKSVWRKPESVEHASSLSIVFLRLFRSVIVDIEIYSVAALVKLKLTMMILIMRIVKYDAYGNKGVKMRRRVSEVSGRREKRSGGIVEVRWRWELRHALVAFGEEAKYGEANKKRSDGGVDGAEEGEDDGQEPDGDDHREARGRPLAQASTLMHPDGLLPHKVEWRAGKPERYKLRA